MGLSSEVEIEIINISIGVTLKLKRLELGISQHALAVAVNSDNTSIGRIERAEHYSSWPLIHLVSKHLGVSFSSLFELRTKQEILNVMDKCYALETRLTDDKKKFYETQQKRLDRLL